MNIRLIHGVLALAVAGTARGGEVLDSEFDGGNLGMAVIVSRPESDSAQTFTVGAVCNVPGPCPTLCRVEVLIRSEFLDSGALLFDVRETTADGVPLDDDTQVLASVVVPVGDLPTGKIIFFSFDVSDFEIAVQAGDVLAIVLRSTATGPGSITWWGATFNPYADGTHYGRNLGAGIPWTDLGVDTGFRTYVLLSCTWDCSGDNDGDVGILDFLVLLAQWGGPGSCDFDGGGVGIVDFLDLLGHWGPCP